MHISQLMEERVWTLWIEGELDAITSPELQEAIESHLGDEVEQVVVNLSALRTIDASGVAVLVGLYKQMRERGGELRMTGVNGTPRAIFRLLGLDRVFTLPDGAGGRRAK